MQQTAETFEVRGSLMNTITAVELYNSTNTALVYPLEIVSFTPYRAVIKIPEGTYNRVRFKRDSLISNSSHTVTLK